MTEYSSYFLKDMDKTASILVLGVGNPILSDDGVGIHVLKEVEKKYPSNPTIEFDDLSTGGLSLAERFVGYKKVIIIDALALEDGSPGVVHRLTIDDFNTTVHMYCAHDCNLATAYDVLKKELGKEKLPEEVIIIGIEAEIFDQFSEELSELAQKAVPIAVSMVESELTRMLNEK
ncbi:MAG: hydrogenase maturation protease [Asgard group archaeon]|nr:hydrogenase maturation protease [Asgard group archaeon]